MTRQRGSILIFTMWVLMILAIFTIMLSRRASSEINLARYEFRNLQASYLAKAGIVKILSELEKDKIANSYDSLNEGWAAAEDNSKEVMLKGNNMVRYSVSDESARLNLNSSILSKEQIVSLGVDDGIAQKIIEYKNKKGNKGFEFMEELFLADGMTREAYSAIKDLVTIYRGQDSKVNINTANAAVLEAVTQDSALSAEVVDYRQGPDGEDGTEDDGLFENASAIGAIISGLTPGLFTVRSDVFRIKAQAFLQNETEPALRVEAVVDRSRPVENICYWKED
jgi:type II secretory pathway component PulK